MKNILLISTGGTIASRDTGQGLAPSISPEALTGFVPEINEICKLDAVTAANIDSLNLNPLHWLNMAKAIRENYGGYDGFIISHGTDTMGYSAAAMSYLIQNPDKPIILTGSQKPVDANITDGKKNLLDAVRLAASGIKGVYVVFDGRVIVGTRARKVTTKGFAAYESINFPLIANMGREPFTRHFSAPYEGEPVFFDKIEPNVCLLKLAPGMRPDMLKFAAQNYRAVVIESFGAGGLPQNEYVDFLGELPETGALLMIGTQAFGDGTDMKVTEIGRKALGRGLLEIYDMNIETAVVKLMWLLGRYSKKSDIVQNFYRPVHWDILYKKEGLCEN